MLQGIDGLPGIESEARRHHRRQGAGFPNRQAPFGQPRLFVPILVVDQSQVFSWRGKDSRRLCDLGGPRQQRVELARRRGFLVRRLEVRPVLAVAIAVAASSFS